MELLELVDATLDLNRLEAGRESVTPTVVDLAGLFVELAAELESLVPPGVTLHCENAVGARRLLLDRAKVKTVLKNLLGNALRLRFRRLGSLSPRAIPRLAQGGDNIR